MSTTGARTRAGGIGMTPVRDRGAFLEAPVGRCMTGQSYAVWCGAPDLGGSIHWAVPDGDDGREMLAAMDFIRLAALAPASCILMDCRAVDRIDTEQLVEFTALARERMPRWSPRIARQAIIVPAGVMGILMAGVLPVLAPSHPFRFTTDLDEALAFVDHPHAAAAHAAAEGLAAQARGGERLLAELRAQLTRDLVDAKVDGCAAALGLSPRTLQRELRRRATSFSTELRRARIAAAVEQLRLSDVKIDAIALGVGFGTASRMTAALRRELGASASELRARARR